MKYTIYPLSEDAVLIHFGHKDNNLKLNTVITHIENSPFVGFIEMVPAYDTITIYYNPFAIKNSFPFQFVKDHLENTLNSLRMTTSNSARYFEIPVCYETEFALDLADLSAKNHLTVEEAITLHTTAVYDVAFIGFSPGFPFLSGLNERLYSPRKTSPRLKVKQGSVGIAGNQTGIYSLDSPGGWQIIGRTPVKLFNVLESQPTLLKAGDQVKFYPITMREFYQWEEEPWGLSSRNQAY